jgi:hypothetical protein
VTDTLFDPGPCVPSHPDDGAPDFSDDRKNHPVLAFGDWATNAELIGDCVRLGYLRAEWRTLDPTFGLGTFWKQWWPDDLVACDLDPSKSPIGYPVDFAQPDLPWPDRSFDCVVIDGPYKLNGTPDETVDERYGIHVPTRWQDRMALLRRMLDQGARLLGDHYLLFKCQDQVCSGKVRWQTDEFTDHARSLGLRKVDRFDYRTWRPQPTGRRQVHAARNTSQLLVFKRGERP